MRRVRQSVTPLLLLLSCAPPESPTAPRVRDMDAASAETVAPSPPSADAGDATAPLTQAALSFLDAAAATPAAFAAALDRPDLATAMTRLARALLALLPDDEKALLERVLVNIAAGEPAAANLALARLRATTSTYDPVRAQVMFTHFELHSRARLLQKATGAQFDEAFRTSFREHFAHLDDLVAEHAAWWPDTDLGMARADVQRALAAVRSKGASDRAAALELTARYAAYVLRRDVLPLAVPLLNEDNARRYDIDDDVRIPTKDGATLSAIVVRPRRLAGKLPAVLVFNIYTAGERTTALTSASHGYVGVAAFTRGRRKGTGEVLPYEHDGKDANATLDWITKQPWSDGTVGMYGGSYGGFTQWAAAKYRHPALKTIVPSAAAIPGQGLPMENNVFLNVNYGWAFYVGSGPYDDDKVYFDRPRWGALPEKWFTSGRPFREVDAVDGAPNRLLQRWLAHPSYDAYWQAMVPSKEDFARIDIPVLSFTGYYDDGQISALRYFTEHHRYKKDAQHYLVIGPSDHFGSQRRPAEVLRGYEIDPGARIDTTYITFGWLDHVLRGGPRPELVADKVNFEVMGANVWRHAASLEKARDEQLTLYLSDGHLTEKRPAGDGFTPQVVDMADRKTSNGAYYPDPIVGDTLDTGNGLVFEGEPLAAPVELDGKLEGELRVTIDTRDLDVSVVLYEKTAAGKYMNLTYFLGRASYARDPSVRRLLTPGKAETLPFDRSRMVSRRLAAGSRFVVVLNVNKNPFAQVNHGTGKDVSDESASDAKAPLHVKWHADSFVRLPIKR